MHQQGQSQVQQHSTKQKHHQEKNSLPSGNHLKQIWVFSHCKSHCDSTSSVCTQHQLHLRSLPLTPLSSSSNSASTPLLLCSHAALKLPLPHLRAAQPEWLPPIKEFYTACLASGAARLKDKGFMQFVLYQDSYTGDRVWQVMEHEHILKMMSLRMEYEACKNLNSTTK